MASNITTVYNTTKTAINTLIGTGRTRIPNPYNLEANNKSYLENGWGLKVGSKVQRDGEFGTFVVDQILTVVLTRQIKRLETDSTSQDAIFVAMLEDVYTLQKDFYNNDEMGMPNNVRMISLGTVSGIEPFLTDKLNFFGLEAEFIFTIAETL